MAKKPESEEPESTAQKLASGEIGPFQAIRIWLNTHPLKRGWYIAIFLLLLTGYGLLYHFMGSQIGSISRDRDKYFEALQPWQAMAAGIFPNQPPEKQLELLRRDLLSISNALHYAIPSLPYIKVESFNGLPINELPSVETNKQHLKLHRLEIRNSGEVEIDNFRSRFQIPEPIIFTKAINQSIGTLVGWRPLKIEILTTGTAGRSPGGM